MSQWFVESANHVQGPFTTEAVQKRLISGQFQPTDKIWGRVLSEWRPLSWWTTSLRELVTQEKQLANPEIWHYAYNGSTFGPLAWNDLVQNLRSMRASSIDELFHLRIWTKGMKEWAPVLEFHEIINELGVNKREHPRAEIAGQAILKSMGNVLAAPIRTISEGGFGCDPVPGLLPGENVTVEIQSEALRAPFSRQGRGSLRDRPDDWIQIHPTQR